MGQPVKKDVAALDLREQQLGLYKWATFGAGTRMPPSHPRLCRGGVDRQSKYALAVSSVGYCEPWSS
jgi:hypothetical protein